MKWSVNEVVRSISWEMGSGLNRCEKGGGKKGETCEKGEQTSK